MIKLWRYLAIGLFSSATFAVTASCPYATASSDPSFCSSFKAAAACRCVASGLPNGMCTHMNLLYDRMISMFGSVDRACQFQHDTPASVCKEDWQCYRYGGLNLSNALCSGTGQACE